MGKETYIHRLRTLKNMADAYVFENRNHIDAEEFISILSEKMSISHGEESFLRRYLTDICVG